MLFRLFVLACTLFAAPAFAECVSQATALHKLVKGRVKERWPDA